MKDDEIGEIRVESLYGARTDKPLVKLIVGSREVIIPPEKARQLAQWLIECAEASYSDAFVLRFLGKLGERDPRDLVPLLREFRTFRELSRRAGREQEEADQAEWEDRNDG